MAMWMHNCLSARWAFFVCVIIAFGVPVLQAGFNADIAAWVVQDRNAFQNYEQLSDVIVQPSLTLTYSRTWINTRLQLFYEGSLSFFQTYSERQYQTHYGGFAFQQYIGETGPVLSAGLQIGQRANRDSLYAYYDYSHQIGYFNVRKQWGNSAMSLLGIWMQRRHYQEWQSFNQREMRIFFQQSLFLPSRTTVIARIQLGNKKFLNSRVNEIDLEEKFEEEWNAPVNRSQGQRRGNQDGTDQENNDSNDDVNTNGNGSDRGNGSGNGQGSLSRDAGRSVSFINTTIDTIGNQVRFEIPGEEVLQWVFSIRIAQSIHENTGVAVESKWRRRADGHGRFLLYQDSGYEEDDPLFDDVYSYESDALSVEVTQKLPWRLLFRGGWRTENKFYDYLAQDLEGNVIADSLLKEDNRQLFWATISRRFSMGAVKRAEISISYNYIDNQSNEPYSDYRDQVLLFGWSFGF